MHSGDNKAALERLRDELVLGGRTAELEALDLLIQQQGLDSEPGGQEASAVPQGSSSSKARPKTYLKLKKKFYTPAEVARRVGVSRQTVVKWIERGELEAELTPGGHHRITASVFQREGRGDTIQLIPVDEE
jgi:excisionase family DNA binding protein